MMNIPTADRQKPGTVMLGGNYLPKQMMPARFDYNTGNYFVSISFFSFLELAYRETLIKGDYISSKPKYNQQDRSYSIRLCVWKEGKFLPGIALGANDPIADKGANTFSILLWSDNERIPSGRRALSTQLLWDIIWKAGRTVIPNGSAINTKVYSEG